MFFTIIFSYFVYHKPSHNWQLHFDASHFSDILYHFYLRYAGAYKPDGRQFIVVCGNINYESVQTFLGDFFHPARDDVDVEVLFLNKEEPGLEFEGLLKREHTRVNYFRSVSCPLATKLP